MVKLNMSNNNFYQTEAGKALGDMVAANMVLKELDLSKCNMQNSESVKAFAVGLSANGALVKLLMADNKIRAQGGKVLAKALKYNQIMRELDLSNNDLDLSNNDLGWKAYQDKDVSGVIAIANAIPTMGALTSLDISTNFIGAEGAKHVAEAIKEHVSALRFD